MSRGYVRRRCPTCGTTVMENRCGKGHEVGRGGQWSFALDVAPPGAPRRRVTRGGFPTKRAALEAMSKLSQEVREGTHVEASRITVGEYLARWAEGVDVRASTRSSYESHCRLYLIPRLGEIPLQVLDRAAIKKVYAELAEKGSARTGGPLADQTVHHVHVTLHRALEDAVEDRLIPRNPADRAHKAPKPSDREEMKVWTESQVADFLRAVRGDRLFALWRLALMSGARRGELIGLRWGNLDLRAGTVTFVRQLSRQGGRVAEGPTKTGRARRTIDIDQATVDALIEWSSTQAAERAGINEIAAGLEARRSDLDEAERGWLDGYRAAAELVFTRPEKGPGPGLALDPDGTSARWNRLVRASGLERITIHEARHTHATLLLKDGVPAHVVSARLGHSSVAFTLQQYGHVIPGQQQEAAARLAAMIDPEAVEWIAKMMGGNE